MKTAITPFSYNGVAPDAAARLQETANAIRSSAGRQVAEIIATGSALIDAKRTLLHGQFGTWLAAEFGWSESTARNYMRAAEAFGANPQRVADLPVAVVYRLAALPNSMRDQILESPCGGEKDIINLISQHRLAAEQQAAEATKSPEARAREKARKARAERDNQKHKAAQEREEEEGRRQTRVVLAELDDAGLAIVAKLARYHFYVWDEVRRAVVGRAGATPKEQRK